MAAVIHLGQTLLFASSGLTREKAGHLILPYLALLWMRFTKPACYQTAGELLPRHFTLTSKTGGIFSVALALNLSFGLNPLGVTQHPAL